LLDPKTETETLAFSFEGDLSWRTWLFFFWPADLENSWRKLGEMGKRGNWDLVKLPQCIRLAFQPRESDRSKVGENVNGSLSWLVGLAHWVRFGGLLVCLLFSGLWWVCAALFLWWMPL